MIKNRRQYRTTRDQLNLLTMALSQAREMPKPDVFVRAHIASLETDIELLESEIRQYDSLRQGDFDLDKLRDIGRLGQDLIRARIYCNMTQEGLAKAVGKKEQAIQRLEATNYSTASLATVAIIASTLLGYRTLAEGPHGPSQSLAEMAD